MKTLNELELAKELIKFPSITPVDAGVMKFLEKELKKIGFKKNRWVDCIIMQKDL